MHGPREVLNELKWREGALDEAWIHYVHRGAPGDERVVPGRAVEEIGRSFLTLVDEGRTSAIPFHRIFRIRRQDTVLWERPDGEP